jgi:hypothetical protein
MLDLSSYGSLSRYDGPVAIAVDSSGVSVHKCVDGLRDRLLKRMDLTLSSAEAGRFLHTAPSTLEGTYVSAFHCSRAICKGCEVEFS